MHRSKQEADVHVHYIGSVQPYRAILKVRDELPTVLNDDYSYVTPAVLGDDESDVTS